MAAIRKIPIVTVIDGVKAMRNLNLEVRIKRARELRLRVWLGLKILWLATWVIGCDCDVVEEGDD